jgi:DNA-binding NtrC family response regulator
MDAQRPLLVASDSAIAEQIRNSLKGTQAPTPKICSFAEFANSVCWNKSGAIAFVANPDEGSIINTAVQEACIRQAPIRMALICNGDVPELNGVADQFALRLPWPGEMGGLADFLKGYPQAGAKDEKLTDVLANRLLAHTPSLLPQVHRFALAATHDITVLFTGETGTGKTYLARLLHEFSARRQHPFLMVPCGAQASNLFESTFFGHVKGAYTGAHQNRPGRFASAGKGTILLDEVDALGLEQQASLLRVIETGEYELVGGNETMHSEARIIVASNADLEVEVAKGRFRADLFYRLNVMSFHLQPLRKRRQDIPLLARSMVARFNTKFNKGLYGISPEAMALLEAFDWPGNIRQLENTLQAAVLVSSGRELTVNDLPELQPLAGQTDSKPQATNQPFTVYQPMPTHENGEAAKRSRETLFDGRASYERDLILRTLSDCRNNRSHAARSLGVSRVTLYKKLKQYGLTDQPPERAV